MGEDDAAANATRYGMPDVGIGDGDAPNWVPAVSGTNVRFSPNIGRDGDEHKITYFTPASIQEMSGLQAVFSFIPEMGSIQRQPAERHRRQPERLWLRRDLPERCHGSRPRWL